MDALAWYLVTLVVIWSSGLLMMFGPGRRAQFYAALPRRRIEQLVNLIGISVLMSLSPPAMIAGDRGHHALYLAAPLCFGALAAAVAWLGWRASRAGEPTWWQWKHSIPARPGSAE